MLVDGWNTFNYIIIIMGKRRTRSSASENLNRLVEK